MRLPEGRKGRGMKRTVVVFGLVIMGCGNGWAFGPVTHAYVAMAVAESQHPDIIWGAIAPDFAGLVGVSNPTEGSRLVHMTHYEFDRLADSCFAIGFSTHNSAWGADYYAHLYYDPEAEDIFSIIVIRQLSQEFGISMQQGEALFEAAIDYLIRVDYGPDIGTLIARSAAASGEANEQAAVDAFAEELSLRVPGLPLEEAENDIRGAFEAYCDATEVYGNQLTQDVDTVRAALIPLLAAYLEVDFETAETYFSRTIELCADYQTEMDRIVPIISPHLPAHDCVASEGEGEGEGEEEVDFCMAFGQVATNSLLGQVGEEYGDLIALLEPVAADINGPFHVDISDDQNYVIDVSGNGMLDAGSELGPLARILADPSFDNGVLTHTQVHAAWQHNWDQLLYGNIGPTLAPVLPPFVPGLMEILVGYISLGDGGLTETGYLSVTGEGSFGFVAGLLALLDDALEDYFGSGFADPVLDKADFIILGTLSAVGDADGDGYSNLEEYVYFTPVVCPEYAKSDPGIDYVTAALNARICPDCPVCPECTATTRTFFEVGEDACLSVPGDVPAEGTFAWSKVGEGALAEGRYLGVACKTLLILNLQESDSGTYVCQYEGVKETYVVGITVAKEVPATDQVGLAVLLGLLSVSAGARILLRRRDCV